MRKTLLTASAIALTAFTTLMFAGANVDYDHKADFSNYHTYSWAKVQAGDQLWEQRIQQDINAELATKGWQMVPSGGQVTITAFEKMSTEQTLTTFYDGFGGGGFGWRRGFGGGFGGFGVATTTPENIEIGTLTVDMFDSQSKQLLWRGQTSKSVSGKADKDIKKLQGDVKDLFKHFPPESKG